MGPISPLCPSESLSVEQLTRVLYHPRNRAGGDDGGTCQINLRIARPHAPAKISIRARNRYFIRRRNAHVIAHARTAPRYANHRARIHERLQVTKPHRVAQHLGRGRNDQQPRPARNFFPAHNFCCCRNILQTSIRSGADECLLYPSPANFGKGFYIVNAVRARDHWFETGGIKSILGDIVRAGVGEQRKIFDF
jgi:hypothetical protein